MLKGYPLPKQSPSAKDFINSKEFAEKHKAIKEQKKSVANKMSGHSQRPSPPRFNGRSPGSPTRTPEFQ